MYKIIGGLGLMLPQLLAISAAMLRAMMAVSSRRGLLDSDPLPGVFVTTSVMALGLWVLALPLIVGTKVSLLAISAFVVDGVMIIVARLLLFISMERVGAGISMSILGSQSLFTALFAMALLSEEITPLLFIGIVLIVVGVSNLYGAGSGRDWKKLALLFPLIAAMLYGVGSIVVKFGLTEVGSPIIGSTISSTAAFFTISLFFLRARRVGRVSWGGGSIKFFCLAGIFYISAILSIFSAIMLGNVSMVIPLYNTTPLFTLFFCFIFLREVERITYRILMGAVMVVLGAILVAI